MSDSEINEQRDIPPIAQPKGFQYYLGTWSGRLLIVNTVVFILMCFKSGSFSSILLPDSDTLWAFGAKDPFGLSRGEWWRFVTPIFVHAGIIHFAFNSLGIYFIGYQLERVLGARWFLAIYLFAGIAGNISSGVFSVHPSVGASGALFGLLGCGYYIERTIGKKIKQMTGKHSGSRMYSGMVVINVIFGMLIPGIDNAAHMGGLITGGLLTVAMVNLRPNRLTIPQKKIAYTIISSLVLISVTGAIIGMSPKYQGKRLSDAAVIADTPEESYRYYSEAIKILPDNVDHRFNRGRLLLLAGEFNLAIADLRIVAKSPVHLEDLETLVKELETAGMTTRAWELRTIIDHAKRNF